MSAKPGHLGECATTESKPQLCAAVVELWHSFCDSFDSRHLNGVHTACSRRSLVIIVDVTIVRHIRFGPLLVMISRLLFLGWNMVYDAPCKAQSPKAVPKFVLLQSVWEVVDTKARDTRLPRLLCSLLQLCRIFAVTKFAGE